ncbi:MAG: indolepyruvate ferredoxin oxidoreductase subunit alpha [Oscillospiraceae bacterium]|nr:indolepyruvate ferredoxin oxidoreductase subunit alpha [Oscillospiraceae bacterium]
MKELLLGNEAVARGLYEAGAAVVSSYPGTPSTEITQYASGYDEIYCEWASNEKVGLEVAIGAAVAGKRAFSGMKHVGLNVAADPLYTVSYTGINAGLVVAVADDPGMHSSQNEQDSRNHAKGAKVPMLEPADSGDCLEFTKLAFDLSERFDTPVMIRLTTRVSHGRSIAVTGGRTEREAVPYKRNIAKYVMMPINARPRHPIAEERTQKLIEYAETAQINKIELNSTEIGVISSGVAYTYAKEALGKKASYLKLGMVFPLPEKLILDFASKVKTLYVIEELDDFIETHCRKLGVEVKGKDIFPLTGEYSQNMIREKILGEKLPFKALEEALPARPPVMCAGCTHRGVFYALSKLDVFVSGDIGCYTLGAAPPLGAMDTCICMGASISGAHGAAKAVGKIGGKLPVAVIGDSTFMHTGINSLINAAYNGGKFVTLILDNLTTGMTGGQHHPSTGYNIMGKPAHAVDYELLCRAIGITDVKIIDPYDLPATIDAITAAVNGDESCVIIFRRSCVLQKTAVRGPALTVDEEKCTGCKMCLKIGCPATSMKKSTSGASGQKMAIDRNQCVGCGQCVTLCRAGALGARNAQE